MPIYEYQCAKCGIFEITQKISDQPLTSCPTCREKVKKLISNTTFQLKGTGWYLTDYARKDGSSQSPDKKDGKESSSPEKAEKPAVESKATKAETSKSATT